MFIKKVKRPNGSISIRVVESRRQGDKISQKTLRIIGQGKEKYEIEALCELAKKTIYHIKNKRNPVLSGIEDEFYGSQPDKKSEIDDSVKLKEIKEVKRVNEGIVEIFGSVYDQLGFYDLIEGTRKDKQWNSILKSCVLARIGNPVSKRRTAKDLFLDYAIDIPLEKMYRMMDHVSEREDFIKSRIGGATRNLLKEEVDVLFFDVTTLYFESFSADELRNFGFSKDCKFKETQVVLALVTTKKGLPITYKLFPGNISEGKTLIDIVKILKKDFDVENVFLVADRAMFVDENLSLMEKMKINYIVASKLKGLPKDLKDKILTDDFSPAVICDEFHWTREYTYKGRRLIVGYSSKRARKDQADRKRLIERLLKKVKGGKIKVKDLINNNGTKKYINVSNKSDATINTEKVKEDSRWDGLHGVITNINSKDKNASEIFTRYRDLWQIEEAFRVNKHNLKMRPIFHWKENRIKAHVAICFIAYSIIKHTLSKLDQKKISISFTELKSDLLRVESSIVEDTVRIGKRYKIPSKLESRQKSIYKAFSMKRDDKPYAI